MKPETKAWLDKVTPILAHLKEGGYVRYKNDGKLYGNTRVPYFCLLNRPDLYAIHVEPRVIYVNENDSGLLGSYCSDPNEPPLKCQRMVRFVEDLNWKPDKSDRDADHHLPEPNNKDHTPPQCQPLSKQATDYMKTV